MPGRSRGVSRSPPGRYKAPPSLVARALSSRSPPGRLRAAPSLVARSSLLSPGTTAPLWLAGALLSPGGAAPLRLAHCAGGAPPIKATGGAPGLPAASGGVAPLAGDERTGLDRRGRCPRRGLHHPREGGT